MVNTYEGKSFADRHKTTKVFSLEKFSIYSMPKTLVYMCVYINNNVCRHIYLVP